MSTLQKIGIVGTGRMGSNIAKRLNDVGYTIVALYDLNPESAHATAAETGGEVTASLPRVTALADVIITVVTDDAAMYEIFTPPEDSLLTNAAGKFFVNCATVSPQAHVEVERAREGSRRGSAGGLHGQLDSASAQRHALLDDRRPARGLREARADV